MLFRSQGGMDHHHHHLEQSSSSSREDGASIAVESKPSIMDLVLGHHHHSPDGSDSGEQHDDSGIGHEPQLHIGSVLRHHGGESMSERSGEVERHHHQNGGDYDGGAIVGEER